MGEIRGDGRYLASTLGPHWAEVHGLTGSMSASSEAALMRAGLGQRFPSLGAGAQAAQAWEAGSGPEGLSPLAKRVLGAAARAGSERHLAAALAHVLCRSLALHAGDPQALGEGLDMDALRTCQDVACAIVLQDALSAPCLSRLCEPYQEMRPLLGARPQP
jgi:hypothetical protein